MSNNILITPGSASIQFSGSAINTIWLQVEPSGTVAFYGNAVSGALFNIVDSLSGSLMAVNDMSGIPIVEVFSDDRVVMGTFNRNTLVVTGSRIGVRKAVPNAELDITGSLILTGSANITAQLTASSISTPIAIISGSGSIPQLLVVGSAVSQSVFSVRGSQGELLSVVDNLQSGSLMSVNDISGLPVLEVFSDDRVVMGSFNKNTLVVTGSRVGIGSTTPNANLDVSGSVVITGSLFVSGSTPLEVGDNASKLQFGSTNGLVLTGSNWQILQLATSNPSNAAIVVFDATGSASPVLPKWLVGQRHGNHGRLSFWRFTTTGGGAGHQPNTLTLTSQSLVGINTNDPQATLHVVGNVSASSFTGSFSGLVTSASYAVSASVLIGGTSTTDQAVSPFLLMGAS